MTSPVVWFPRVPFKPIDNKPPAGNAKPGEYDPEPEPAAIVCVVPIGDPFNMSVHSVAVEPPAGSVTVVWVDTIVPAGTGMRCDSSSSRSAALPPQPSMICRRVTRAWNGAPDAPVPDTAIESDDTNWHEHEPEPQPQRPAMS